MTNFFGSFLSEEEQKKLSRFSRKAKGELSKLPVISAIGDAVQGASGFSELQTNLELNPNHPQNWLYYYEGFTMYKKINMGASVGRLFINPVGFIIGKTMATGLNTLDDEYEKFDPRMCLGMAITLVMKKIKEDSKKVAPADLVILAKALAYSSAHANKKDELLMLERAIKYTSLAIHEENSNHFRGECYFYLAQFYHQSGNELIRIKALNLGRKMGFEPAGKLLALILRSKNKDPEKRDVLHNLTCKLPHKNFHFTYQPSFEDRANNSWEHVKMQQTKKFSETKKRANNFFGNILK